MLENISLFKGLNNKMAWLTQRQRVFSQNIANADTPGYRPSDIKMPDFARVLGESETMNKNRVSMATTQSGHVSGLTPLKIGDHTNKAVAQRQTYEVSPTGNAVDLEEQMLRSSEVNMDYQMMTNLYGKNMDSLRNAMRGQR